MTSILMRDPLPQTPSETPPQEQPVHVSAEESADFEIVLGKRQIAGVLFVASVFLALFSAVSYIAGEAMSPRRTAAAEHSLASPVEAAPSAAPVAPAPVVVEATKPPAPSGPLSTEPLFAEPKTGELYLQLGALDKGISTVVAEGLRTHGFEAFVAPGPSEKVFRVLIGPLADNEAYRRTKDAVDDLGLNAFAKKYQQ